MSNHSPIRHRVKSSEEGYLLLSVVFLMALLALWLSVAVPQMTKSIQRDRDLETMERGKQYIRAIQLYYRKFGAYPPSVDALVKTNDIRFLRKKYIDPTTGKNDWKPILYGQNKVPIAMGFFGQPLGGSTMAGIGPSGGNGLNGTNGSNPGGGLFNSNGGSGFGAPGSSTSGFGSSPGSSMFGSSDNDSNSTAGASSTDNSGNSTGSGTPGATGANGSGTGGTGSGSGTGLTGQTFGGAGIIGFSPASPKQSILVYKKKDHYNEWEFTYDPIMDMKTVSGGNTGMIGQPAGSMNGQSGLPGITPLGPGTGTTGTPQNGAGSTPTMPPDTSAPQQQ